MHYFVQRAGEGWSCSTLCLEQEAKGVGSLSCLLAHDPIHSDWECHHQPQVQSLAPSLRNPLSKTWSGYTLALTVNSGWKESEWSLGKLLWLLKDSEWWGVVMAHRSGWIFLGDSSSHIDIIGLIINVMSLYYKKDWRLYNPGWLRAPADKWLCGEIRGCYCLIPLKAECAKAIRCIPD